MSRDEFHLFLTYSYLFGNKHVKSKLSISRVFLMYYMHVSPCDKNVHKQEVRIIIFRLVPDKERDTESWQHACALPDV
jgi:hypothetical protein